tara:strand:+ start:249 stop:410 length:162 start_codon:yes stop_codon:yes gene_type:complete
MNNTGYGQKLDAGAKMRYKMMIDQHNREQKAKKKKKDKSLLQMFADKLYGGKK